MPRPGFFLALIAVTMTAGCGNPQTVTQSAGDSPPTPTAPAATGPVGPPNPSVQQASANSMSQEFQQAPSGLKYKIVRPGDPQKKPTARDTVLAHYKGWLDDGTIFDSSYDRGEPIDFPLSGVIPGWTEGLQLIGKGGEIELEIPSKLGYGPQGAGRDIPPNATLHFKVELIDVM